MQGNEISVPDSLNESAVQNMQPMSFSEILDGMFSLYRKHFKLYFRMVVIFFVITYAIDIITMSFMSNSFEFESRSFGFLFPTIIVSTLTTVLVVSALSYASAEVILGRQITASGAYQRALHKYFPLLACYFLYLFVCSILAVTCIGLPFSIFLFVRWGLYTLPILIEDKSVSNALRRSGELVKNMWWRVCGIMVALLVIYQMIQSILSQSFGIVFFLLTRIDEIQDAGFLDTLQQLFLPTPLDIGWSLYLLRSFVTTAIVAITLPIITIGSTLLYFDLRIRKDAYDLEMQATQQDAASNNQPLQESEN